MRLRPIASRKLCRILENIGFLKARQKGSHAFYKHPDGRCTAVPIHAGENIGVGLLVEILKDIELGRDDFEKLV
jgi:predicted RNA binding protein YcfA (HicA-like mRNA interferase family)